MKPMSYDSVGMPDLPAVLLAHGRTQCQRPTAMSPTNFNINPAGTVSCDSYESYGLISLVLSYLKEPQLRVVVDYFAHRCLLPIGNDSHLTMLVFLVHWYRLYHCSVFEVPAEAQELPRLDPGASSKRRDPFPSMVNYINLLESLTKWLERVRHVRYIGRLFEHSLTSLMSMMGI